MHLLHIQLCTQCGEEPESRCGYKTARQVVCGTVVIRYVSLLQVYTVRGDYDTAIRQLQKAAALDPEEKVGRRE